MKFFTKIFCIIIIAGLCISCGSESSTTEQEINNPPQNPVLIAPNDGVHNVNTNPELSWSCLDLDDDILHYDVYLSKDSQPALYMEDITETSLQVNDLDFDTRYYWKITAKDEESAKSSAVWRFNTKMEDLPPIEPYNPEPENNEIDLNTSVTLHWVSSDPNNDVLKFDIYFGTQAEPELFASDVLSYQYAVSGLEYHTMYYWKIIAKSNNLQTSSPLWCFETRYLNYPPDIPNEPEPADSSINVSNYTELEWECSDEENDPILYDIYFGTTADPELVFSGEDHESYDPGVLAGLTQYYWKIKAYDESNFTMSPVWTFTTGEANNPPDVPHMPWPEHEAEDESIYGILRWTCSDPDGDSVFYRVYFGEVPQLNNSHIVANGLNDESLELGVLEYETTYYWKIQANDGDTSTTGPVWSFTTESETE